MERSLSTAEIGRVKSLKAEAKANISGFIKAYSTNGNLYIAAEYKNGKQINESINVVNLSQAAFTDDVRRKIVAVELQSSNRIQLNKVSLERRIDSLVKLDKTAFTPSTVMKAEKKGWFGCMGGFFSSDAGTATNLLGIATGVGCVACGFAAGAITGVAALGCLAAI